MMSEKYANIIKKSTPFFERLQRKAVDFLTTSANQSFQGENFRYSHEIAQSLAHHFFEQPKRLPDEDFYRIKLNQYSLQNIDEIRLVFLDGNFCTNLSSINALPSGLKIVPVRQIQENLNIGSLLNIAHDVEFQQLDYFIAQNFIHEHTGVYISLEENVRLERPIHITFLSSGLQSCVYYPFNIITCGKNSRLVLIEDYIGLNDLSCWANSFGQITVRERAQLDHYTVLRQNQNSYRTNYTQVQIEDFASYHNNLVGVGAKYNRNVININAKNNSEVKMQGVYNINRQQVFETIATIEHLGQNSNSEQKYRGIISDQAEGIFQGKIVVAPHAQKTQAQQLTKTLLLSDEATVNVLPQLEINADDVKCSHGATVGQLDQNILFYLLSRGISKPEAMRLMTKAFASEIINKFDYMPIRQQLEELLVQKNNLI